MATQYADSAGAQGDNNGTSAANAMTLKNVLEDDAGLTNALAAGDIIYCKNGTTITYDGSAGSFATPTVDGTATAPIRVEGYATSTGDGGIVDLVDTNGGATNNCFNVQATRWRWRNFRVTDARDAWSVSLASDVAGTKWGNCHVVNGASEGWDISAGTSDAPTFESCSAVGCVVGFDVPARNARFVNCVAIGCSGAAGFQVGSSAYGAVLIGCLAHANTGDGFSLIGECLLVNCVANRNGSDGYNVATADGSTLLVNCGATSNGAYGIIGAANSIATLINCAMHPTNENNLSGKSNTITLFEFGEVTGDPDFTDSDPVVDANVDLSLSSSSAWKAAGAALGGAAFTATATFNDLGPAQREEPAGGGGGLLVHPGMTGGYNA